MGFLAVDKSCFTLETDLPPSSRNIHPSGVLHATRSLPTKTGARVWNEQIFAWIHNTLYIDSALDHLEKQGFDRSRGIVFIPYSSKHNWLERYPQVVLAMESTANGDVVVSDIKQHLGTGDVVAATEAEVAAKVSAKDREYEGGEGNARAKTRKDKYIRKHENLVQDQKCLRDSERDELHVEIYKYFSWLRSRLARIEKEVAADASLPAHSAPAPEKDAPANDADGDEANGSLAAEGRSHFRLTKVPRYLSEVVLGLGAVLESLEGAFPILFNIKREAEDAEEEEDGKGDQKPVWKEETDVPFLEEGLRTVLAESVAARELAGKGRRSRKRPRKFNPELRRRDFDELFRRLERYREEHGDCNVLNGNKEDPELARWVAGIRLKNASNLRKGIEFEKPPPGKQLTARALTKERIGRLNSIGFTWNADKGPRFAWEDRFNQLLKYYEIHGKWPSQSEGQIGTWVHLQRKRYARGDPKFMRTHVPKLDEIGFEWTPRGNTRMNWAEGFEMLMKFGSINGHYNVPEPPASEANIDENNPNRKSDAYRLYRWVESLHGMYRSYKLGRQSGSLTDERVAMLIQHGFVFRTDWIMARANFGNAL